MMKEVHVICCNDSVQHVFDGPNEAALLKLEELAQSEFDRQPAYWQHDYLLYGSHHKDSYTYYRNRCYWHIHNVPISTEYP